MERYIAGCFGGKYEFLEGQAPAVRPVFHSTEELLAAAPKKIENTPAGKPYPGDDRIFYGQDKRETAGFFDRRTVIDPYAVISFADYGSVYGSV